VGLALSKRGKTVEAEKAFRDWTRRLPKDPQAHYNLGNLLCEQQRLPEAMTELHTAIDLCPSYAEAHDNLGLVLSAQGDFPAAEAAHRKAIEFYTDKEGLYRAYINLGSALARQDRQPESVEIFHKAIDLRPELPDGHYSLGLAMVEQGRMAEAITAFRATTDRKSDHSDAQCNLGFALLQVGQYREAREVLSRCLDLIPTDHPGRARIKQVISACPRLAALDDRLPAMLAGKDEPADATQRAELASVCLAKGLVAASTRLYEEAFRERPELTAGRRYDAARAAALAGCGHGKDSDAITDERRALCREQTLTWLRAELASSEKLGATATGCAQARRRLLLLQRSPDFAGLRDQADLARLPDAEKLQWREFWADLETSVLRLQPKSEVTKPEKK
jgi:tetratricopeptide (TPR) repeat protein